MPSMLSAPVPRNLRVRPTLQIAAGTRLPAHGFLLVVGCVSLGGMAVMFGANLERTAWVVGALMIAGLFVVEGRLWGRDVRAAGSILARHARRPRRLRLAPLSVELPPEAASAPAMPSRRPRWQTEGQG